MVLDFICSRNRFLQRTLRLLVIRQQNLQLEQQPQWQKRHYLIFQWLATTRKGCILVPKTAAFEYFKDYLR